MKNSEEKSSEIENLVHSLSDEKISDEEIRKLIEKAEHDTRPLHKKIKVVKVFLLLLFLINIVLMLIEYIKYTSNM